MLKWIETTGRTEDEAIAKALEQLGMDRDDVSVEVVERAKSGFLGFGGNPAKVRVSYEVSEEGGKPVCSGGRVCGGSGRAVLPCPAPGRDRISLSGGGSQGGEDSAVPDRSAGTDGGSGGACNPPLRRGQL
mgnify:CR=1 FL=1